MNRDLRLVFADKLLSRARPFIMQSGRSLRSKSPSRLSQEAEAICRQVLETNSSLLEIEFRDTVSEEEGFTGNFFPLQGGDGGILGVGILLLKAHRTPSTDSFRHGIRCSPHHGQRLSESAAAIRRQEVLQSLIRKFLSAQEEARCQLARELHDDFSQRLAILAIDAGMLEQQRHLPEAVHQKLQTMKENIIRLAKDVHDLSRQLHPSILEDFGLIEAIRSECALFSRQQGIAVHYHPSLDPAVMSREVAVCIFRIVQESLRNIVKHARAEHIDIQLTQADGDLLMRVKDDGSGFDPTASGRRSGLGLQSMEERALLVGGSFVLESAPGEGTAIEVRVPLQKETRE